ncbi:MAG: hypothetical protein RLZZ453_270 [Chlamydiota bacterium]|jgi:biopolymer transport protein ExbB
MKLKILMTLFATPLLLVAEPLVDDEPLSLVLEEAPLTPLDEEISFLAEEFDIQEPVKQELVALADPIFSEEKTVVQEPSTLVVEAPNAIGEPAHTTAGGVSVDLGQAFRGSPAIYSVLFSLSVFAVGLFFYVLGSIRWTTRTPKELSRQIHNQLMNNHFQEAFAACREQKLLLPQMLSMGIQSRGHGLPLIMESMKTEAKRSTVFFWQKIGLLNDIAIIAPMLGLLGTVLGMFYAFYDVNRSIESISTLFDGLGVSVGTTVAGLLVAILSLILHSIAKYRLVRALAKVENEAQSLALLLDDKTYIQKRIT